MFAEVYPLARLPRRFKAFDYAVPEGMVVSCGSFVMIPLRGKSVVGIVKAVKQEAPSGIKTKPIMSVLPASVTQRELAVYEGLASDLVQSVSSVLDAVIPTPPKRLRELPLTKGEYEGVSRSSLTIPSDYAQDVTETVRFIQARPGCFVRSPDLRHSAAVIATYRRSRPGPVRVAAPNVRDALLLHAALEGELLTGEETNNARFNAWQEFRNAKDGLLVGTRLVSMLEHKDGSNLFLVRSGHENHHQADRNPRYDSRRSGQQWMRHGGRLVCLDAFPRPDDVHVFGDAVRCPPIGEVRAVGMEGRETWTHPFVSPPVFEAVQDAMESGERVLLAFNRKGMARVLTCRGCGWTIPLSGAEPPRFCDSCHSRDFEQRGYGTRAIAKAFQGAFPGASVAVCEKGEATTDARIVVATKHYLENIFDPFRPESFALVADLDADSGLADRSFRAQEKTVRTAADWHGVARTSRAQFLLQTATPGLFSGAFHDPVAAMTQELENRRSYGLEPSVRWITVDGQERAIPDGIPAELRSLPDSVVIDTNAFS